MRPLTTHLAPLLTQALPLPKPYKSTLPSPFLEEEEDEFEPDELDDSADEYFASAPPPKRPRRSSTLATTRKDEEVPLSATGKHLKPSNRKVSHSLIERRRREEIDDCLATLRDVVPQCREQGEAKVAKAKERGRKRGRKADDKDDADKGGLHKLEILQGTIVYIEQLEARLAALSPSPSLQPTPGASPPAHRQGKRSNSDVSSFASLTPAVVSTGRVESDWPTVAELARRASARSLPVPDDAAADLLLSLTSPELRPVMFA